MIIYHLNFTKMKKQILFLTFVILAFIFASTNTAFGQTCTPGHLNPAPGIAYEYVGAISGTGFAGTGTYNWFITQDPNIFSPLPTKIAPGTYFTVNTGANLSGYDLNTAAGSTERISITWTPAGVAAAATQPFFLVLWYSEDNSATSPVCEAENVRAWQISPINTFLLAIEGTNSDGTASQDEVCAAPVVGAVITPHATDPALATINVTYGENALYFNVTASGILGEWRPSIRVPALSGSQEYVSVDWSSDGGTTWNSFGTAAAAGGDLVSSTNATVTDVDGTTILVRVVVDNVNFETLNDQALTFGIDGHLPTGYTVSDIKSATDCTEEDAFGKQATYTITARPTLTGTPAFMNKVPVE